MKQKIIEFHTTITQFHEKIRILYENHETHENHRIQFENHENHENLRTLCDN